MKLPHLLTTARRFVDGVCKVPDQLELIREAVANYDPQGWRAKTNELLADLVQCRAMYHALETELAAEREAHVVKATRLFEESTDALKQHDAERNRDAK